MALNLGGKGKTKKHISFNGVWCLFFFFSFSLSFETYLSILLSFFTSLFKVN